ncbi:MAG: glycosyltransferase, partial [Pygmaiobacter sp.]
PQGLYKKETVTDRQSSAKAIRTRLGFPENSRLIVSAGSLNFGKGADLLPLLAKELARQDAELAGTVQFVWLGSAAETSFPAWLLVQIEKMELSGCIHFPGFFENEKEYMACLAGADVFLLPSREDSMPSVLLEAMAAGTPTLAFCKSGGADELLRGDCGVLTPFCDLQQMAQQLCRLLRDEPFARQIAENAKLRQQSALSFDGYVDLLAAEFERAGD